VISTIIWWLQNEKERERLSVSKRTAQKFDVVKCNSKGYMMWKSNKRIGIESQIHL
jgi:hypothetical protein